MAFSRKLLAPGEEVILESHPNWSILVPRVALALVVIAGCIAAVVSWSSAPLWVGYVLLAIGLGALAAVAAKVVTWRSTTLVVTNGRVVYRTGALRRFGREIPLSRVQDVTYRQSLLERMLGAGSLTIESAGQSGQEPFPDIAHPAMVQSLINSLMFGSVGERVRRRPGVGEGYGDEAADRSRRPMGGEREDRGNGDRRADYPPDYGTANHGTPDYGAPDYGSPDYGEPTAQYRRVTSDGRPPSDPYGGFGPSNRRTGPPTANERVPPAPTVLPPRWVGAPKAVVPAGDPDEGARSSSEELARLLELNRLGVITDAELAEKRRELLGGY